jgi:hypothetical protein
MNIIDLQYMETRHNTSLITPRDNTYKDKVYVHIGRNRFIKKFSRKEKTDYIFSGIIILKGTFYNWINRRLYRRPELASQDYINLLNDYISSGGKIYGYIVK